MLHQPTPTLSQPQNNERLAELAAVKLRGLLREHLETDIAEVQRLGGGACARVDDAAWVYFPTSAPGLLGSAVVWAASQECSEINLIVDQHSSELAHAASGFAEPRPAVWKAIERRIEQADPVAPEIPAAPACAELTAELASAGLDVVADHGVWIGEINGLEVARVGSRNGECSVDIGVGAHDQFASAALNQDNEFGESLASVIAQVEPHRRAGAAPHAIGRLVRSRWLRAQLMGQPELVGLDSLNPIPLLHPRPGLLESQPAAGLGERGGSAVLVVCTVGLDLGIAETAAGLIALHQPDEVVVVVPPRDRHQRIVEAAARLAVPAVVVAVEGEWSD